MYKKILTATDGSKYSKKAVREALAMAKAAGCPLVIVSAVDVTDEFETMAPGLEDQMIAKAVRHVEAVKKQAQQQGVRVDAIVRTGEAYEVIVTLAREKKADIIVLGSHGRTGLSRLLMGSVTSRVIGHAPCPVLVVPS